MILFKNFHLTAGLMIHCSNCGRHQSFQSHIDKYIVKNRVKINIGLKIGKTYLKIIYSQLHYFQGRHIVVRRGGGKKIMGVIKKNNSTFYLKNCSKGFK